MSSSNSNAPQRRGLIVGSVLVLVALIGGGVWYGRGAAAKAAAPAADSEVGIMLGLADGAYRDRHWIAPVGSNVYEFYASVLQLDPQNAVAIARLHEAFVPACDDLERAINDDDVDEAQRELRLLRDYDGKSYILALLGGKLEAKRTVLTHQHEAEAARIQAQQVSAN
jgi:periplasmic protein TonB